MYGLARVRRRDGAVADGDLSAAVQTLLAVLGLVVSLALRAVYRRVLRDGTRLKLSRSYRDRLDARLGAPR